LFEPQAEALIHTPTRTHVYNATLVLVSKLKVFWDI